MTRSKQITLACLLVLSVTTACSKPSQSPSESAAAPNASPAAKPITSQSVVKIAAQPVDIPAGGSAEARFELTIQNGYHVNANPPTYPYLKATELDVSPGDGISVSPVSYPKAVDKKFPFAEKLLAVYEGGTEIKATLKADKSARPGKRSISAKLRIQACDDQVCYAPGTVDLVVPVTIK